LPALVTVLRDLGESELDEIVPGRHPEHDTHRACVVHDPADIEPRTAHRREDRLDPVQRIDSGRGIVDGRR
jgi:hypothetical protein